MARAVLILLVAILYAVMPMDLIPDVIPAIGQIDDLLALTAALVLLWRRSQAGRGADLRPAPEPLPEQASDREPHEVLGIPRGAPPERIRNAYRELIAQYHPDKVAHLGPELRETAQRKTLEIQKAYETLSPP